MIDPPQIANLLSAGQRKLNYFCYKKKKIKCACKMCVHIDLFSTPLGAKTYQGKICNVII